MALRVAVGDTGSDVDRGQDFAWASDSSASSDSDSGRRAPPSSRGGPFLRPTTWALGAAALLAFGGFGGSRLRRRYNQQVQTEDPVALSALHDPVAPASDTRATSPRWYRSSNDLVVHEDPSVDSRKLDVVTRGTPVLVDTHSDTARGADSQQWKQLRLPVAGWITEEPKDGVASALEPLSKEEAWAAAGHELSSARARLLEASDKLSKRFGQEQQRLMERPGAGVPSPPLSKALLKGLGDRNPSREELRAMPKAVLGELQARSAKAGDAKQRRALEHAAEPWKELAAMLESQAAKGGA